MEANRRAGTEVPSDYMQRLYGSHYQGVWLRSAASLFIWLFAFGAYQFHVININNLTGISAAVAFLILMNPPALWVLKLLKSRPLSNFFSLFVNLLEIIGYTAVIYFVGGIRALWLSPIYAVLISHIGIIRPRRLPFIIAALCAAALASALVMEYVGLIPSQSPIQEPLIPWQYQVAMVMAVTFYLQGVAFVSAYTAGLLKKSRRELREKNIELEKKAGSLELVEKELRKAHQDLERRVEERTVELEKANDELKAKIEERKQALEALRASEEMFRSLSESAPDIIYTLGFDGAFTYVNPAWERILGHKKEEVIGRYFIDFAREEDAREYVRLFKRMRDGKETLTDIHNTIVHKDGSTRLFHSSGAPITNAEGKVTGIASLLKDVTDQRKLQAQLFHAQKLESIGTISSGVAHNFRNILAGISVNNQLIEMRYKDNQHLMEISERINNAVMKGSGLVDGLMKFCRKERVNDFRMLNLAQVIHDTQDLIRKSFDKKIDISIDVPETIPMMGDRSGLSQVIMNLCTNARDAMPDGGELRIKGRQKGEQVEVVISDTGHGMDQETRKKCFDPFFTTKEVHKGTGLGLSTAYGIVKEHGGDIHVYSEINQGATFRIYFPMKPAGEGDREEIGRDMIRGKGQKILIVDDEMEMLKPVEDILEGLGFRPAFVGSGGEALEKYASWQPDVVLMDRNMPGMDGISCAKKILRQDLDAKIILISGYDEKGPNGIDSPTREFVKGYLTKPIEIGELSHLLARLFSE